ncbi:LOW QUALITY PROTEIN: MAM domain-containing glycosylphosphatidylinositol anchor protein 2 [Salvelinus alpinus]
MLLPAVPAPTEIFTEPNASNKHSLPGVNGVSTRFTLNPGAEPRELSSDKLHLSLGRTYHHRSGYVDINVKMGLVFGLLWLFNIFLEGIHCQGVYAPPTVRIIHSGHACNVEEERYTERVYTIREGETLELACLVSGHPRPQIRWTKTAGSASDRFQDSSVFNETLRITRIQRLQGGRYYCKAENGLGSPAIKSIRVDVYYLDDPIVTVHQSIGEAKEQFYYERTVFLRCMANSNPPVRYSWRRGQEFLSQGSDKGVEIYEPFFTQGETKILKLKNLRPQDYANYSCIASVRNVCGIANKNVLFKLSNKTASPTIKLLVEDPIVVNPGQTVTLVCVTSGGDPTPTLTWVHSADELPKKSVLNGGTLTLPAISIEEAGVYSCVASNNVGNPAKKSTTIVVRVPPELTVPRDKSPLVVQEGDTVELQCLVSGKPKPIILWSRADKEVPMPDGGLQTESYDGALRIVNVSREMTGTYRCATSQYNGFNVKPREALVELTVQYPPAVEPLFTEIRQGLGRAFTLNCRMLRAHPSKVLKYEWKLGTRLLTMGQLDQRDETDYHVRALNREGYGEYTCEVTNEAGAGACRFLVTGRAYAPEFYYDTYSALWQNRPRVYGFKLQWTQQNPLSVDRIVAYRLGIKQTGQSRWWEQEIPMEGAIAKGELITHNLTELIKPEAYLVRLTPITRFGEGDSTDRTIRYSAPVNPHLREFQCSFEDEAVCMFTQDKTDDFDWTRHSAATRDTKYTPNTGPSSDRVGSKQGFYMYIETSRPRLEGEKARLLTPTFNVAPKSPYGTVTSSPTYCFGFYYHMYGKHIGALNAYLRQKAQSGADSSVWTLVGNQGDRWKQAKVNIHPTASFQLVLEGIRGPGIEGDIAIDDVTIEEGECKDPPHNNLRSLSPPTAHHIWQFLVTLTLVFVGHQR